MSRTVSTRSVTLTRDAQGVYTATNAAGDSLQFGRGEGLLSPVELLLAAVAGCSSIDVDMMTSRRAEPTRFEVTSEADYIHDDATGNILENIRLAFDLAFPEGEEGDNDDSLSTIFREAREARAADDDRRAVIAKASSLLSIAASIAFLNSGFLSRHS